MGDEPMKAFLKNEHKVASFCTSIALLTILASVSYYYLHYDSTAISWVQLFSNLFLLLSALVVASFGISHKKNTIFLFALSFACISFLKIAGEIFSLCQLSVVSLILSKTALAVAMVFLPVAMDQLALGKKLILKPWYLIAVLILGVVPTLAPFIIAISPEITEQVKMLYINYVSYGAWSLLCILGIVMGVFYLVRNRRAKENKHELFVWSYIFYCAFGILYAVLEYLPNTTSGGVRACTDLTVAFALIGIINTVHDERIQQK